MFQKWFIGIVIAKRWNDLSKIPTQISPNTKKQKQLISNIVAVPSTFYLPRLKFHDFNALCLEMLRASPRHRSAGLKTGLQKQKIHNKYYIMYKRRSGFNPTELCT